MRKIIFGVFLTCILTSCNLSNDITKTKVNASLIEGTEQGNGMASYLNEKMGITFQYPSTWRLSENAEQSAATLDNSPLIKTETDVSSIRFSINPEAFGERFREVVDLKAALIKRWPERDWKESSFEFGQSGYFWKTQDGAFEMAEYYLLDQNLNVLTIQYKSQINFGGSSVIKAIVASMTVDNTPPVVERVYFEPSFARPGEKVKLVVEAWDEIGQVELSAFSNRYLSLPNEDHSDFVTNTPTLSMGYVVPFKGGTSGLHNAYPLNNLFISEGGNRYSYEFTVPAGAPEGIITMPDFRVSDSSGQEVYFTLDTKRLDDEVSGDLREYSQQYRLFSWEEWNHNSSVSMPSKRQRTIQRPELEIRRTTSDRPIDQIPPTIKKAWFEKTIVNARKPGAQKLFLQFEDDSSVVLAKVKFSAACYLDRNASPKNLGQGIYEIELGSGASGCNPSNTPIRTVVSLKGITAVDEVGNVTDQFTSGPTRASFVIQR